MTGSGAALLALSIAVATTGVPASADPGVSPVSTGVWIELASERQEPEPIPGATWFLPDPASLLEVQLDGGVGLTVWRVEVDHEGRPTARIEQLPEPLGDGRFLLWIPPSPRAHLAIVPASDGVRAWVLEPVADGDSVARVERRLWRWAAEPESPYPSLPTVAGAGILLEGLDASRAGSEASSPASTAELRLELLLGRLELLDLGDPHLARARAPAGGGPAALDDGGSLPLSLRGPAILVLDARARATDAPPPTPQPYDLTLWRSDDDALARLPTGSLIAGSEGPVRESVRRRLLHRAPPGDHRWRAAVDGCAVDLGVRTYRARPRFPSLPDSLRVARLARQMGRTTAGSWMTGELDEAERALAEGDFSAAQDLAARRLDGGGDDAGALILLARAQARIPPVDGLTPAALTVLERAVQAADREGVRPADDTLREALRGAWLQATAYVTRGVRAPEPREALIQALPDRHPQTELDADGWLRPGVFRFLSPGRGIELTPDAPGADPARWTVVQALGLNLSGRPAVVSLRVDEGQPQRVLLDEQVVPFRLALAPGAHRIELTLPPGADDRLAVGVDLPAATGATGPWGETYPHVRTLKATRLEPDARTEPFGLPETGGPAHLRLEVWWTDDSPQELVLESAEGRRRVQVRTAASPPALRTADGCDRPGDVLAAGTATVDLGIEASWVRVQRVGGTGPAWVRVSVRAPRPHPLDPGPPDPLPARPDPDPAGGDLERLSRSVAEEEDPRRAAAARAARAELLLGLGLPAYARRDIEQIREDPGRAAAARAARAELLLGLGLPAYARGDIEQIREDGGEPAGLERLATAAPSIGGPHGTRAHAPPVDPVLALDLPAAAGSGGPAWLDDLPGDDLAHDIARGDLQQALPETPFPAAIHLALARQAVEEARDDPGAAVEALLHASAVRTVFEDPEAARITQQATDATRPDHLGTAEESADRVLLGGAGVPPDPLADPALWARWTMLGATLPHVDRLLASGTRWVVHPARGAPAGLTLEAFCDDLRPPRPGDPATCQLELQVGDSEPETWVLPRGQLARREVGLPDGDALAVALASGGHARYVALALRAEDATWRVDHRQAWYHVARPDAPVCYRVNGPTRLSLETAPRADAGPILLAVTDGGDPRLVMGWSGAAPATGTDQGGSFGAVRTAAVDLFADGPRTLEFRAEGAPVAVRVTRRVASEVILPPPPEVVETSNGESGSHGAARLLGPALASERALRLPRPSPAGTLDASVSFWDRWSTDLELSDERYQYVQVTAIHRLRPGDRQSWFYGGGLARIGFTAGPSFGLTLGTFHRIPAIGLRLNGRALGLIQRTDPGTFGSLALRGRIDRPTRLAPDLTLVPYVRLRGFVQPQLELEWFARRLDMELASSYRRAHPFGVGAGADLVWRPWVDGTWLLSFGALSNPSLGTLDNAGGHVELRLHPRPIGLAARFHLSHRFADEWRPEGWWRAEVSLGLWADLGPPDLWIRPELRLSYLLDPARLEATLGLSITPGRRAAVHFSPADLLYGDLREPVAVDGRWLR